MRLDLQRAVTLFTWLALVSAVVATVMRWRKRTHPGYGRWTIAGVLLVLSLFLLGLRQVAPDWISIVSGNAGIAIAAILYLEGAREFRCLMPRSRLAYAGGVMAIGAVVFYSYSVPSMNMRAGVMSTFLGIVLTAVSFILLRGIPAAQNFSQTLTGGLFGLCALTSVARGVYCYLGPPMSDQNVMAGLNGVFFLAIVSEMASFSVGLNLLVDERMASDLNETKERASRAGAEVARHIEVEAALRESEERFRRVFEEGPLGLGLVGKDHRLLKINSAFCQMLGYSEGELVQKTFTEITHPDDVRADVELAERVFKGEIPSYRIQKRYVKKSGEIIWVNLTASVIFDSDGEPLYGLGMVEDITEIKRSQEEAQFWQKLESVGTLAGGIAHDFNNLLGAIQAQTELASSELEAGASCREQLKAIREVAMRGSEIVRQLMIYAGKESAVDGSANVSKIVDEMLALLKVSVTKHVVIRANLDQDLPPIPAAAAQLRQIVMNLITNASDAIGDRDGIIRVSTRPVTLKGESTASASGTLPDGDYVQLEVSDTGCGMSQETQAKVFDPFFTTKTTGRGMGLAVVQGIVRSLRGAIHLTSEPGGGTTFQVLIPRGETTSGASSPTKTITGQSAVRLQNVTVLIVEDEDQLRRAVVKMLRKNGFNVFEVADGSSAINLLRAESRRVDLILLDMTIPGASSHDVVKEATSSRPDIRVILTSAYSHEVIEDAISLPQVHSFIRKPFQFEDLLKTLRSSLS